MLAFFAGLLLLAWVLRGSGALDRLLDAMEAWSGSDGRRLLGAVQTPGRSPNPNGVHFSLLQAVDTATKKSESVSD